MAIRVGLSGWNYPGWRGTRADVAGNLWISSNGPLGYAGVLCFNKDGKLLGRLRLPDRSATACSWPP